jgi:hypothetical protein
VRAVSEVLKSLKPGTCAKLGEMGWNAFIDLRVMNNTDDLDHMLVPFRRRSTMLPGAKPPIDLDSRGILAMLG